MECRCNNVTELYGDEMEAYLGDHLRLDGDRYVCPDTGRRWELDESDPAQRRLVQI